MCSALLFLLLFGAAVTHHQLAAAAAAAAKDHRITVAPGVHMPYVNLGGVSSRPSNYSVFLEAGGRGIDTALTYGDATQQKVAAAIATTSVARGEIFLTTKVPCCPGKFHGKPIQSCGRPEFSGSITKDIEKDTKILGQIDLVLLHWPCDTVAETLAAWAELETALTDGHTRAIGISNANASMLQQMLPKMKVKPAVNQCGHSIGAHNASHNPDLGGGDGTVAFCKQHGISYSAYSPLGGLNGIDVFKNKEVIEIAQKHGVSAAQVALRWLVQQNITVVTAGKWCLLFRLMRCQINCDIGFLKFFVALNYSSNAANEIDYIKEDIDLFSFSLTADEMHKLAQL
jgi:2,5-diketo-D-gluconate reductase A